MKHIVFHLVSLTALAVSCSLREENIEIQSPVDDVFYASFEPSSDEDTKVYAGPDLFLRWVSDDRVSIFNKLTYNQQYRFTGKTGANYGGFRKVNSDEFVTGNKIDHVVSVYPYQESTDISEEEVLSLTLPSEQVYQWNSFGKDANTMVAVSTDSFLLYKNVCGYLRISLYGEKTGITVSSITLKGNDGERIAGRAFVTLSEDGTPSVTMADDATDTITLMCENVWIAPTADECCDFWFAVPPTQFKKGFTITINQATGASLEKTTSNSVTIERGNLSKMSPIGVEPVYRPNGIIYYTTKDGYELWAYNQEAFGANLLYSIYEDGRGLLAFDGDVTSIGDKAFLGCQNLTSIVIPDSVTNIGYHAFGDCSNLTTIEIPRSVTSIGYHAFGNCSNLTTIEIPRSVTSIGYSAFSYCTGLTSIIIPNSVTCLGVDGEDIYDKSQPFTGCTNLVSILVEADNPAFDSRNDCNAIIKTDTGELISGCSNTVIPDSVRSIGNGAFHGFSGLTSIVIPNKVTSIGDYAFYNCGLNSIELPTSLTSIGDYAFYNCGFNSIELPTSLTSIGGGAFDGCLGLTWIELPSTVTNIGSYAFGGCSNLRSVTVFATNPPTLGGYGVFPSWGYFDRNYPTIYVPAESVGAYRSAQLWTDYRNFIRAIPTPSVPIPEAIDLGLSVKWASFNVGASSPEEYGNYYAWGEISTKSSYASFLGYRWCRGSWKSLSKYNTDSNYGTVDNRTLLMLSDDAARENLGGRWRMPTAGEIDELVSNCSWTWTSSNGVNGYCVKGPNGNSIFLPAAGRYEEKNRANVGKNGYYWSASLRIDSPNNAYNLDFASSYNKKGSHTRTYGLPVRPVID